MSTSNSNQTDINERLQILSTSSLSYNVAQQVCPNCKHVSPYIPQGNIVQCPSCGYQSSLVEHAQQW
jgi:exosome complex RNA-binding protein Csl4